MLFIYDYVCGVHMHIDLQQLNCIAVVIRTCAYNVKRELRGVLPDVPLSTLFIHIYIYIHIYNKLYYTTLYIRHIHARTHTRPRYYCRSHRIIHVWYIISFFLSFVLLLPFFFCVQPHHYNPCNTSNRSHKKCLMVKNRVLEIYSLMAFKRILNNTRIRIYMYTILL